VEIKTGKECYLLKSGQWALLLPGQSFFFQFSNTEPSLQTWIHGRVLSGKDPWAVFAGLPIRIQETNERMRYYENCLLKQPNLRNPVQSDLLASIAETAFLEFFSRLDELPPDQVPRHPSVDRALNFIQGHFHDTCDLEQISRSAGTSPQRLSRLFRKELGMTPIRYLWYRRGEEGIRLLRETGLTVAEISHLCGFQNPYHFSRRIRQEYGASPAALRKRAWAAG
jgi:AraC-like DNA-binding protein